MKTSNCAICGKEFYKYRKVLQYCSRQCSGIIKRFKETNEYKEKIKIKITSNMKICPESGCWNYITSPDEHGRSRIWFRNTTVNASRVSYTIFKEEIPQGLFVCHACDNHSCVNPEHLFLGSAKDNALDCQKKGRHIKGELVKISKLKANDIKEIFELTKKGWSQTKIAQEYNVSQSAIGRVLNRKTWNHIIY